MEEAGGGDGRKGTAGENSAFIQWLTAIQDEIDSTADILKEETRIVKVRRITPNLEILGNELRAQNGGRRVRKNVVIGLDDAVAKAIKNLQHLRAHLKEGGAQQQFNISVDRGDWMDASRQFRSTPAIGGDDEAAAGEIETIRECHRRGDSEAQATAPSDPVPQLVAGCAENSDNYDDGRIITKQRKTDQVVVLHGCHSSASKNVGPNVLLPPEIWGLVLDKVEDPQDWLNLYRTSTYFQDLVGGKRTTALLTQVLPHVFKYLTESEMLKVRQVPSRQWKRAVDTVLENSNSAGVKLVSVSSYRFLTSARISSFLERFDEAHSGNPFVGRSASFMIDYGRASEAIEEYSLLVTRLLAMFGAQLKTLCFTFRNNTLAANCASWLQRWLMCVPNLNSLQVHYHSLVDDIGLNFDVGGEPLPFIHNLNAITFRISGVVGWEDLMELQNGVVRLSCNPNSLKSVRTVGVPSELLTYSNVESAVVKIHYSNLATASWPLLSKLVVSNWSRPISALFKRVEHFKGTLTSLRLKGSIFHNAPVRMRKLHLPHLKRLAIERYDLMDALNLNCFSKLTTLEVLIVHQYRDLSHHPNPAVAVQSCVEVAQSDMTRLRVWEEGFPNLTKIWLIGAGRTGDFMTRHVSTRSSPEFQRKQNLHSSNQFQFGF